MPPPEACPPPEPAAARLLVTVLWAMTTEVSLSDEPPSESPPALAAPADVGEFPPRAALLAIVELVIVTMPPKTLMPPPLALPGLPPLTG